MSITQHPGRTPSEQTNTGKTNGAYGPKEIIDGWIASHGHEVVLTRDKSGFADLYGAVAVSHFDTDFEIDEWGEKTNINYWYFVNYEIYH